MMMNGSTTEVTACASAATTMDTEGKEEIANRTSLGQHQEEKEGTPSTKAFVEGTLSASGSSASSVTEGSPVLMSERAQEEANESYMSIHDRLLEYSRKFLANSVVATGMHKKEQDGSKQEREKKSATAAISLKDLVGDRRGFMVGAFRRTPYRVGCYPLALSVIKSSILFSERMKLEEKITKPHAGVVSLDDDDLSIWFFTPLANTEQEKDQGGSLGKERDGPSIIKQQEVYLCCQLREDDARPFYLGKDLKLYSREECVELERGKAAGMEKSFVAASDENRKGSKRRDGVEDRFGFDVLRWYVQVSNDVFRGMPGDIPIHIFDSPEMKRCLCSQRHSPQLRGDQPGVLSLVFADDAESKDEYGRYMWNNAWECIPDDDEALEEAIIVSGSQDFLSYLETTINPT